MTKIVKPTKIRIDKLIFEKGLAPSRERAASLVMAGCVLVDEKPVTKPGHAVSADAVIRITGKDHDFVGRGGLKLEHALKEFKIDVAGLVCADIGASTGGFTDCLLKRGVAKVFAIDVGYGQLAWSLQSDKRVVVMDRVNIREVCLSTESGGLLRSARNDGEGRNDGAILPEAVDLAVIDVSFISLTKVLPSVDKIVKKNGQIVALIKPQFEVGRENLGKGGIVRDEAVRDESVKNILSFAQTLGLKFRGLTTSPIKGADGNVEFLAWFVK